MKKFINFSFAFGLATWFLTAVYLSVNSLFNIFVETDPSISKGILAGSFLWTLGIGIYNKYNGGDLSTVTKGLQDMKNERKKSGCKTCGK